LDQNNYIERLSIDDNAVKNFNISSNQSYIIILVQRNLFSDLYLAKFLDTLAKSFFPCKRNEFKYKIYVIKTIQFKLSDNCFFNR